MKLLVIDGLDIWRKWRLYMSIRSSKQPKPKKEKSIVFSILLFLAEDGKRTRIRNTLGCAAGGGYCTRKAIISDI
jgi:hypothetical protein